MTDFQLDERAVAQLFTDPDGMVAQHIRQLAEDGAGLARGRAPRDTGRLAGSIRTFTSAEADGTVYGGYGATAHADPPLGRGFASGIPYALDLDKRAQSCIRCNIPCLA